MAGTLKIINSQDEVGGYPAVEPATTRSLEVPEKHRDAWLEELAREVEGRETRRATTERPRDYTQIAAATVQPLATQAAIEAYEKGGNAIDAAIAAAVTLGVVDGHNSGIGGGCFILIHAADGTLTAIDGREMAPAASTRDMFVVDGKADPTLSRTGPLASGVPGALAAWEMALKRHGNLELADVFLPAAEIAEAGFPIDEVWARKLKGAAEDLVKFPTSAAIFLKPDGSPMEAGGTVIQTDLAKSYRAIAEQGSDWFYRGPFAQKTADWMAANGGIMTAEDFGNYVAKQREPLVTNYRGLDVIGFPPPSSGGIHVAQMLQILEHFDLPKLEPATRTHLIAETMKLAFADRAYWLGDSDFAKVPRGLIDPEYTDQLAKKIDLAKVTTVPGQGTPPGADSVFFGEFDDSKHTQHLCTADGFGNWVSMTSTINTGFGSKVVIPGTGIVLNNEMDDFSAQPGVPNAFGLVGAEANAIEPGKRPLSSMSPTLIIRDGRVVMAIGAAGGPTIITQTLQNIVNRFTLGMDLDDSLAAPRIHHQWSPDVLRVEKGFDPAVIESLKAMGHEVSETARLGASQGITADTRYGTLRPAHDPRVPGGAGGK
ncbi:MAG: gamma-glutamyltransferase [Verrucomicrobiae bacterium]|nr:gamma-glutamyltransferase [Verrucomicrobiae bacterium]